MSLLAHIWDFPSVGGEGADRLLSLKQLSSNAPAVSLVSGARHGDLPVILNLLTTHFEAFSEHFAFQILYQLGFCWLFTLFFRKSVRYPSFVHKQVGSAPIYIAAIFVPHKPVFNELSREALCLCPPQDLASTCSSLCLCLLLRVISFHFL